MGSTANRLVIWQQNVNKSPICQHTLLSNDILVKHNISIVTLQEPAINAFNNSIASRDWISVYPTTHSTHPGNTCTLTLIHSNISMDSWEQIDFPLGDVTVTSLKGDWGKMYIFNIYNKGNSNRTIQALEQFYRTHPEIADQLDRGSVHTIWLGDFNRHHPHWDDPSDAHLFMEVALAAAETLIDLVASLGLELGLPSGIPTHLHNITKKWSRLDQVFITEHSLELIEACDTETKFHSIKTDHFPIVTKLNLEATLMQPATIHNFKDVDWEKFHETLSLRLANLVTPAKPSNQERLNSCCEQLTLTLQLVIEDEVPKTELCTKLKRWWTKELT